MLLFAPVSYATSTLPRHLQLQALQHTQMFAQHGLQHWLPGVGLPAAQRAQATAQVIHACLPAVARRVMVAAGAGHVSRGVDVPQPAYAPAHASLQAHIHARVRAQQSVTPQVPAQALTTYLAQHLPHCESAFAWLLQQKLGLQAHRLADRLAGARYVQQQVACPQSSACSDVQRLQAQACSALQQHADALQQLPSSALLRWQIVLAECTMVLAAEPGLQPHGLQAPLLARTLLQRWRLGDLAASPVQTALAA